MVFVLDNYDSFTYNLVQYLGELGEQPEVRRNDKISIEQLEEMKPERIVISPGPLHPAGRRYSHRHCHPERGLLKALKPDLWFFSASS